MISTEKISELLAQLQNWGKASSTYNAKDKERVKYFSDTHYQICMLAEAVSYHADFGVFPEKLINAAVPNETTAEFDYRKNNYKQITKPIWDKALGQTYRIWNKQNMHINWEDEEREQFFNYEYPLYGSYPQFFQDVVHKIKFADPNGVLAVKPMFIPGSLVEGVFIPDQSQRITPIAEIYTAYQSFDYKEGEYALLLTKLNSTITVGSNQVAEGLVFELYDNMNIYHVVQTGKKEDWTFDVSLYYAHNWEALPAWKLKGVRIYDPIETLYYSHFMCAVPNLDQAAIYNSTQFGVINKVAYPTRWYYSDDCGSCNGSKYIENYETGLKTTCDVCQGTGKKFTFSWGKDYVIPMPLNNLTDSDTTQLPSPPIGDHSPSMEAPKFLDDKIKELLGTAFTNLNIDVTEQPTGVTATEVKDDQENKYTFLVQITAEEFDLLQTSLDAQAYMRWGDSYEEERIEVIPPAEFSIRSSYELTEEYKTAVDAKLPAIFQQKLLFENIKQRFKGDIVMEKKLELVAFADPLMTKSDIEVSALVSNQIIPKWRAILHHFIYQFIDDLNKDGKLFDKDLETIRGELEAAAKKLAAETDTRNAESILNELAT